MCMPGYIKNPTQRCEKILSGSQLHRASMLVHVGHFGWCIFYCWDTCSSNSVNAMGALPLGYRHYQTVVELPRSVTQNSKEVS